MPAIMNKKRNIKYTKTRASATSQSELQPSTSTSSTSSRSKSRRISPSSSSGPDTSESEDNVTSTSSRRQNHVEQSPDEAALADESRLVSDCIFYLLVADKKKYAIKKADIMKHVFVLKEHRKMYKNVMKKVVLQLKKAFGIGLLELEDQKGQYIVVNEMKDSMDFIEISQGEKRKLGFTMIVLSIIFMMGDYVPEGDIWKALKITGIDPDVKHPVFGDVKKLLTQELVKQLYVQYRKENVETSEFVLSWGPRAKIEVSKREVLQFICDVYGDGMTLEHWPNQYNDILSSEQGIEESPMEQ